MNKHDQTSNPYAPPNSPIETVTAISVESLPEIDELEDLLNRAYFGATVGLFFFPGVANADNGRRSAYWISVYLLIKANLRRDEFLPKHKRLFKKTFTICAISFLPMICLALFLAGAMLAPVLGY